MRSYSSSEKCLKSIQGVPVFECFSGGELMGAWFLGIVGAKKPNI